jgi:hypothetical protein
MFFRDFVLGMGARKADGLADPQLLVSPVKQL